MLSRETSTSHNTQFLTKQETCFIWQHPKYLVLYPDWKILCQKFVPLIFWSSVLSLTRQKTIFWWNNSLKWCCRLPSHQLTSDSLALMCFWMNNGAQPNVPIIKHVVTVWYLWSGNTVNFKSKLFLFVTVKIYPSNSSWHYLIVLMWGWVFCYLVDMHIEHTINTLTENKTIILHEIHGY